MSTHSQVYINVWRQVSSTAAGSGNPILTISRDTIPVIWVDLVYSPNPSTPVVPYTLPPGFAYQANLQSGWASTSAIILQGYDFNNSGDRSDVNPTNGTLSFKLDLTVEDIATDIGASASKPYHINLFCMSGDHQGFLGAINTTVRNIAIEPQGGEFSSSSSSMSSMTT